MVSRKLRTLALLLAHPQQGAAAGVAELARSETWLLAAAAELQEIPLEAWQAEHTRLFLNGYPRTAAPPFESAYRYGQLNGGAAAELNRLYNQAGLNASEAAADYLGTELEFAAWLIENGDPGGLLSILWQDHLALWLPRFCADLGGCAQLKLYQLLARELRQLFPLHGKTEHEQSLGAAAC
ncbi:TorD/DmsD family molecular chaperone [Thiolapillus sp.]